MSSGTQPDSPVGGDGVETGAGSAAPGLTGSLPGESGSESGQGDSGQLGGPVWRVGRSWGRTIVLQAGDQPAKAAGGDKLIGVMDTPELARIVVDAVNARRVSVDDAVERVAIAQYADRQRISVEDARKVWGSLGPHTKAGARRQALAAVQALRDGGEA